MAAPLKCWTCARCHPTLCRWALTITTFINWRIAVVADLTATDCSSLHSWNRSHAGLLLLLPVVHSQLTECALQVEDNANLTSSRYRHQLVTWGDQILAVGGQRDDAYGASRQVLNVIALDLNTRQWSPMKKFTQPSGAGMLVLPLQVTNTLV